MLRGKYVLIPAFTVYVAEKWSSPNWNPRLCPFHYTNYLSQDLVRAGGRSPLGGSSFVQLRTEHHQYCGGVLWYCVPALPSTWETTETRVDTSSVHLTFRKAKQQINRGRHRVCRY